MLLPNPVVDETALLSLVRARYGPAGPLDFAPVGGDGWHYCCPPFWVSVRRDRQGHDERGYRGAAELAAGGLEFVLCPLADGAGRIVHWLGAFPVVVLPLVEGETLWASGVRPGEPEEVVAMLEQLHGAAVATPLPRERYELPFAAELAAALAAAERAGPLLGPYGEPIRELIARDRGRVEEMVAEAAALGEAARADPDPLVPTHGEPNTGNVLRDAAGRLRLIDWGDLAYGPPERDWAALDAARGRARAPFRRFYDLRWELGEIAEYTARFAARHAGDVEDEQMWRELGLYLQ